MKAMQRELTEYLGIQPGLTSEILSKLEGILAVCAGETKRGGILK